MPTADARPRRTASPWRWVAIAVAAVLAWVGAAVFLVDGPGAARPLTAFERRMPDGSILKVEALTVGNGTGTYRGPALGFDRYWRGYTPRPCSISMRGGADREVTVWMSRRDGRTGRPLDFDWWRENVVVDAAGDEISSDEYRVTLLTEYAASGAYLSSFVSPPLRADHTKYSAWLLGSRLPTFRPRDGRLAFAVKNTAGEVVAEFDLPHPDPRPVPEWKGGPLPQTFTAGDLSVTVTGVTKSRGRTRYATRDVDFMQATMDLSWQGRPAADWHIESAAFVTPLGDEERCDAVPVDAAGRASVPLGDPEWLQPLFRERVWKMSLRCTRKPAATVAGVDRDSLAGIPLPAAGRAELPGRSLVVNGCAVDLIAVGGPGDTTCDVPGPPAALARIFSVGRDWGTAMHIVPNGENPAWQFESSGTSVRLGAHSVSLPWLLVASQGGPADKVLHFRVRDDQGREVPHEAEVLGESTSGVWVVYLQPEADARAVTLDVMLQFPVVVEGYLEVPRPPGPEPPSP